MRQGLVVDHLRRPDVGPIIRVPHDQADVRVSLHPRPGEWVLGDDDPIDRRWMCGRTHNFELDASL
jgi:hypothetical protein